jgi:hypothetical protein
LRLKSQQKRENRGSDNKKVGKPDRSKVAGGEDYEVRYFAKRADITLTQARELIKKHGNDRAKLMAAAKRLK